MGYRGTRGQLEARLTALPTELSAMHEQLAAASRQMEALRKQEWGRLGVFWFRFTLRRAHRGSSSLAQGRMSRSRRAPENWPRTLDELCGALA